MKEKQIKINNIELNYKEYFQENSNKENILIIHWWWWKSNSWEEVAQKLSEKWFRVIVPDLPGFWKTKLPKVFTLNDYAEIIEKFVKKINLENIILWGHSNWGAISIVLENRAKIDIKRLVLNNSAGIRNDKKRSLKRKILQKVVKYFKFLKKIFIFKKLRIIFYKLIWGQDYLNAEKNPALKNTYLNMISSDLSEKIKNIKKNTLIIWWEKDTYTPLSDWYFMRNNIKKSKMIILDNETHWIHLKNPDRLIETFLENI